MYSLALTLDTVLCYYILQDEYTIADDATMRLRDIIT
jgi:hypothetical protein